MFCQQCGAIDDGSVRCSICGANDYGPNKPELTVEQIEAQAKMIQSNTVGNKQTSTGNSDDGGIGCAAVLVVLAVAFFGWIFGWFGE